MRAPHRIAIAPCAKPRRSPAPARAAHRACRRPRFSLIRRGRPRFFGVSVSETAHNGLSALFGASMSLNPGKASIATEALWGSIAGIRPNRDSGPAPMPRAAPSSRLFPVFRTTNNREVGAFGAVSHQVRGYSFAREVDITASLASTALRGRSRCFARLSRRFLGASRDIRGASTALREAFPELPRCFLGTSRENRRPSADEAPRTMFSNVTG